MGGKLKTICHVSLTGQAVPSSGLPLLNVLNSWQAVYPRQQEGSNGLFGDDHLTESAATETDKGGKGVLYHYCMQYWVLI